MITLNEIRSRALLFSKEWERDYSEDAEAKTFWDEFFQVFGASRRRLASFEYPVKKLEGNNGYIDVLWKGVMLAEHKSKGKSLDKAYSQAKDYFPGLKDAELPRYVIVSDFARVRLYDLETDTESEFPLNELHKNVHLFDFITGRVSGADYGEEVEANIEAARLMADFHNEIAKTGYQTHDLEVFLIRTLFCLFAEDTGIFPKNHFRAYIENRTAEDGSDLGVHLLQIFQILNMPVELRQLNLDEELASFPYINGGIFAEPLTPLMLDAAARSRLLKCCSFDWSKISASIFGSIFQGVMDPKKRRELGAHYTSEQNILKVIQPLFLDELLIEYDTVKFSPRRLESFHEKLSELTFLDPACGCGNFLVVTYRELRRLELRVLRRKRKNEQRQLIGAQDLSKLNVNRFYGIEIEEFPALVARVAMYLVDHQMNEELSESFGLVYARIPLREPATIRIANALEIDWRELIQPDKLSYILGNPPFNGARKMEAGQKTSIKTLFKDLRGVGNLDFVTGWYKKACEYTQGTDIKIAFVSTNSITQGEQVGILWKYLKEHYDLEILFAHQTFKWGNDAGNVAGVYCVIIGFHLAVGGKKYLYEYATPKSDPLEKEVSHINFYLTEGKDVFLQNRRKPICEVPEMVFGNMPNDGGNLILNDQEKLKLLSKYPSIGKYIRRLIGAEEFINGSTRWCLWLVGADPTDLKNYPEIIDRIAKVKEARLESKRDATRKLANTPTLFAEIRQPETSYLLIPLVSSEAREIIPLGYFGPEVIMTNRCAFVETADLYVFGILTSAMHMAWTNRVCGRLESRYNYSINIVYNNFPWPSNIDQDKKKAIATAAQNIIDVRTNYENSSLADLYGLTMPPALRKAHNELDRLVDAAYGQSFKNKEERIEFLFSLYVELVS